MVPIEPKPAHPAHGQWAGRAGQVLTVSRVTDKGGMARASIPASFMAQPREHVVLAAPDGAAPTAVLTYQASTDQREQI